MFERFNRYRRARLLERRGVPSGYLDPLSPTQIEHLCIALEAYDAGPNTHDGSDDMSIYDVSEHPLTSPLLIAALIKEDFYRNLKRVRKIRVLDLNDIRAACPELTNPNIVKLWHRGVIKEDALFRLTVTQQQALMSPIIIGFIDSGAMTIQAALALDEQAVARKTTSNKPRDIGTTPPRNCRIYRSF